MVSIKFFGTSAAVPSLERGFACIGLLDGKEITLLDCGDGAIYRLKKQGANVLDISNILITHYHSDHLTGLAQIIETMGIRRREEELNIFGPPGLKDYFSVVEKTTNLAFNRRFKIALNEIWAGREISVGGYQVSTFEMDHTVPTIAYRIIKDGLKIAYSGDTQPCKGTTELAKGVDLLIHEATFLEKDVEKARQAKHSTPKEAAEIARGSGSAKLVMTHVNEAYETRDEMLEESSQIFEDSDVAYDGLELKLV